MYDWEMESCDVVVVVLIKKDGRFCALHGFTAEIRGAMMSLETSGHPRFSVHPGPTFIIFRLEFQLFISIIEGYFVLSFTDSLYQLVL